MTGKLTWMKFVPLVVGLSIMMLGLTPATANIVYSVDDTVGTGTLTGTITTDGTQGVLSTGDLVSWDLTITINSSSTILSGTAPFGDDRGPDLTATATGLYFNFGDTSSGAALQLYGTGYSGLVCMINASSSGCGQFNGASTFSLYPNYPSLTGTWATESGNVLIASATPLPAALPLFAAGLGALGLLGWRRKREAVAA